MDNIKNLTDSLSELLKSIQTEKDDKKFKKLIAIMNKQEIHDIVNTFLEDYVYSDSKNISDDELKLLKILLEVSNSIYNYSGENTGMSDSEYDSLLEFYKDLSGEDGFVSEPLISSDNVVHHKYKSLRGTLDKIYKITDEDVLKNKSQKSLSDWIKQTERKIESVTGESIDLMDCEVIIMPKFDGVSCVFECNDDGTLERALTRGDTTRNEAQDITHIFKDLFKGSFTNAPKKYGEKTEIMMLDGDLERFNEEFGKTYKNTRSIVSSILNSDEKDVRAEYLQIIPLRYSFLNEDGIESKQMLHPGIFNYPYIKCKLGEFDKIRDFSISHKTVSPGLRCDGAVIYITDEMVQEILGRENEKQKYEVAFKFTEEVAYSEVKDIEFTVGLFGRLNPVVRFKPVKMKGNTIQNASLGSFARFQKLNLAKGDIIKIMYDIIPYVDFDKEDDNCTRSNHDPIEMPMICPDCGGDTETSESGDILYCKNPKCPCRIKGKILNYVNKMNIGEISYATVDDFYHLGLLETIQDLYFLKDHMNTLIQQPGYGETKINNILHEIDAHKEVTPSTLLGSIGIEGLSIKTFKNILSYMNMDEILDIALTGNESFFTTIPGIKEITAKKLVNGIRNNIALIVFLKENLTLLPEPDINNADFTVCFTKVRDIEKEDYIRKCGGEVVNSVTKTTSILVVPALGVKSSKVSMAEKYDIPIVPIDNLKKYIEDKYIN